MGLTRQRFLVSGGRTATSAALVGRPLGILREHQLGLVLKRDALDADCKQLRVVKLTCYTIEKVRTLCSSLDERERYPLNGGRVQAPECGMDSASVAVQSGQLQAEPSDLLCHIAFTARAYGRQHIAFYSYLDREAQDIQNDLREGHAAKSEAQFAPRDAPKAPPVMHYGDIAETIRAFSGADQLRSAVSRCGSLLYAP